MDNWKDAAILLFKATSNLVSKAQHKAIDPSYYNNFDDWHEVAKPIVAGLRPIIQPKSINNVLVTWRVASSLLGDDYCEWRHTTIKDILLDDDIPLGKKRHALGWMQGSIWSNWKFHEVFWHGWMIAFANMLDNSTIVEPSADTDVCEVKMLDKGVEFVFKKSAPLAWAYFLRTSNNEGEAMVSFFEHFDLPFEFVSPEDIDALTESPIIRHNDTGDIYFWSDYMLKSFGQVIDEGSVTFTKAEWWEAYPF